LKQKEGKKDMMIHFYDVSPSQELAHLNGHVMTIVELYNYCMKLRKVKPPLKFDENQLASMHFHPYGAGEYGWRRWSTYFQTAVQLISGHTPNKEEIQVAKGFVMKSSKHFKRRHIDHKFVMCFLPYLFIGFNSHNLPRFIENSNSVRDVRTFVETLFLSRKVLFTSFLCSHRDPQTKPGESINLLQSHIPASKVRRSAAMLFGLIHNAHDELHGKVIYLQQSASSYATSSIFPEVTVEYLEKGRAYEMLDRLRYQYSLVGQTLQSIHGDRVSAKLVPLDALSWRLESFLKKRFGPNWRQRNYHTLTESRDPIVKIGIRSVLPSIRRMMPFFSGDFQSSFLERGKEILENNRAAAFEKGGTKERQIVGSAVAQFLQQHDMNAGAKAVHEAAFYYLWGQYCGKARNVFAIGFDRDHGEYQNRAWRLGAESNKYRFGSYQTAPLYARRNPNGREHGALGDLSFRQFWR